MTKIIAELFQELLDALPKNFSKSEIAEVVTAFEFAKKKHEKQLRYSGEPYIIHPLSVALIVLNIFQGQDKATIIASLLHDTIEDTATTLEDIATTFGEEVAILVDGVTKITKLKTNRDLIARSAENFRKMFFATTEDLRVIFIKLADRFHNITTVHHLPEEKKKRIAQETMDVYVQIANRLGLNTLKHEMEDIAFKALYEDEYREIKKQVDATKNERETYIKLVIEKISGTLNEETIDFRIIGRAKNFYSIYKKITLKEKQFDEIHDLIAIRIITKKVSDCYTILGIIHNIYTPLPNRIKDYIALPKSNLYSSLHTTVIGDNGKPLEIQIRTEEMDQIAKNGAACHIIYKGSYITNSDQRDELAWLKKINTLNESISNPKDFMTSIKNELLKDEIYLFTPEGDVIKLPAGTTPLDFAYAIHTEVGDHCIGAKINGKIAPLRKSVKNGNIIEILTSKNAHPHESWLKIVKTTRARSKVNRYLRAQLDEDKLKEEIVLKKSRKKNRLENEDKKSKKKKSGSIFLQGEGSILFNFSNCCSPTPGDPIIGFLSTGGGIKIHKKGCINIKQLAKSNPERIVYPSWIQKSQNIKCEFSICGENDPNLLADIIEQISNNNGEIVSASKNLSANNEQTFNLTIDISSLEEWKIIKKALERNKRLGRPQNIILKQIK